MRSCAALDERTAATDRSCAALDERTTATERSCAALGEGTTATVRSCEREVATGSERDASVVKLARSGTVVRVRQDTHPNAMARYHELLRAQAPQQRLAQAASLTRMTRALALAGIRARHPGASAEEIRARLVVRLYGREVGHRLCGALPPDAV